MADRDWLRTFGDPEVMSGLREAARACMAEVDTCDPELCAHPEQDMSPHDFFQWVEDRVQKEQARADGQRPTRFERGHRPRRKKDEQLALAIAG